ncbi:MAG: tyrosine-type recombinase/integrase family protein [Propionibacteriaceae bacterium]|nr:tyrosine-type recombinase/integrase family protein [Propionibacteriaceae bacterium]
MGTIDRRTNGRYYARWRTPDGKSRSKAFARKRDAEAYLSGVEGAKTTGGYVDPARGRVKLGPWADDWLAGKTNLTPKTRDRYENAIRVHVKPRWGDFAIGKITHSEVQLWIAGIQLAPASVRKIHRVFSQVLATAVRDGRISRNVAENISLPRVHTTEKRFLTHTQVEDMARLVGPDWDLLVRFLAYTGLRWGEVAALRVGRVDLERRRVIVAESVSPIKGVLTWGATKGHERREVAIPQFLIADLAAAIRGKAADDLVFVGPRGGVLRAQTFQRAALVPAAEEMGLCIRKVKDGQPVSVHRGGVDIPVFTKHFHPHEFRHTAASLAIAAGADVKVVQRMLGHKSATMTLDLYGHLFADRLDTVADAMDAARRTELDGTRPGSSEAPIRVGQAPVAEGVGEAR